MTVAIFKKTRIAVTNTPEEWALWSTTGNDAALAVAADRLNDCLEESVNNALSRPITEDRMLMLMEELWEYGAAGTEPRSVLHEALDYIYGESQ
jgi:hypothetical protein